MNSLMFSVSFVDDKYRVGLWNEGNFGDMLPEKHDRRDTAERTAKRMNGVFSVLGCSLGMDFNPSD